MLSKASASQPRLKRHSSMLTPNAIGTNGSAGIFARKNFELNRLNRKGALPGIKSKISLTKKDPKKQNVSIMSKESIGKFIPQHPFFLHYGYRNDLIRRRRLISLAYALLVLFGIAVSYSLAYLELENHDYYLQAFNNQQSVVTKHNSLSLLAGLKWSLTGSCAILVVLCFLYHHTEGMIYKFDNNLSLNNNKFYFLINRIDYFYFILELAILCIHPFWLPENKLNFINYSWVYFLMELKIYYALRVFIVMNELFYSTKVQTVANLNRFSIGVLSKENVGLIVRSTIEASSFSIITVTVFITWFWFSYLTLIHEWRFILENPGDGGSSPSDFKDSLWLIWISFTTIGYGDFYPSSIIGRTLIFIISVFSMITTSILIGVMTFKLTMTHREKMVYYKLKETQNENQIKNKAATVLQRIWRAKLKSATDKSKAPIQSSRSYIDSVIQNSTQSSKINGNSSNSKPPTSVVQISPLEQHQLNTTTDTDITATGTAISDGQVHVNNKESNDSTNNLEDSNDVAFGNLGSCNLIHSTRVVRAIHDFAKVRNKVMFNAEGRTDLEDTRRHIDEVRGSVDKMKEHHRETKDKLGELSDRVLIIEDDLKEILKLLKSK